MEAITSVQQGPAWIPIGDPPTALPKTPTSNEPQSDVSQSDEPQPGEVGHNHTVQDGSGSVQPSEPFGAPPTPPNSNEPQSAEVQPGEPQSDEPQSDKSHQAPPRPGTPNSDRLDLEQPTPADPKKRRSRKRIYGPTVKIISYDHKPEEGYPARIVRPTIILSFLNEVGRPTKGTWSEYRDGNARSTHVRMVEVPGFYGRLWESEHAIMFQNDKFGALVPYDGHPLEQYITFWKPENEPKYGQRFMGHLLQYLRDQTLDGSDCSLPLVLNAALPAEIIDATYAPVQSSHPGYVPSNQHLLEQPLLFPALPIQPFVGQTCHIQVPPNQHTPQQFLHPQAPANLLFPHQVPDGQMIAVQQFPQPHLPDQSPQQQSLLNQPGLPPASQQVASQAGLRQHFDPPPEPMNGMQDVQHVQLLDHQQSADQLGLDEDLGPLLEFTNGEEDGQHDQNNV